MSSGKKLIERDWPQGEVIVHRKGVSPAAAGVLGVIPGSMADPGYKEIWWRWWLNLCQVLGVWQKDRPPKWVKKGKKKGRRG